MDTIDYGNIRVPHVVYDRAVTCISVDENGHWIWVGAHSGRNERPQIGFLGKNQSIKVVGVARLIFIRHNGYCPYQIRRDRSKCTDKRCVNPEHHYAIVDKPEPRVKGRRREKPSRVPGKINLELQL